MYSHMYATKALALHSREEIPVQQPEDSKTQKAVNRRTVDYSGPAVKFLEMMAPAAYPHKPANCFNSKFIHVSTNKMRCAINVVLWMPDGRRLMTGTHSGEFTLWNGTCFNFETIIQAHDAPIRSMIWTHNENFLLTGDDSGKIKYWKPNMENVKVHQAHAEAVRAIAFSPSDLKFTTCSDDSIIKVWDFGRCKIDTTLTGHGGDVKTVDWHPQQGLLASGSKDSLIKLWDPKSPRALTSLHGHKGMVMMAKWNKNGNWLLSAARDQLCKVFDLRMMKELASFRGHNKDVACCSWHPFHEELFASGGYDGSLIYWTVGHDKPQAEIRSAHDMHIWSMDWHPIGHMLATGSNDYSTKFWGRTRPGDIWRDRRQQEQEALERSESSQTERQPSATVQRGAGIVPGLDFIPGIVGPDVLPKGRGEPPNGGGRGSSRDQGRSGPLGQDGGRGAGQQRQRDGRQPTGAPPMPVNSPGPAGRGMMPSPPMMGSTGAPPQPTGGGRGRGGTFRGSVMRAQSAGGPPPPGMLMPPQGGIQGAPAGQGTPPMPPFGADGGMPPPLGPQPPFPGPPDQGPMMMPPHHHQQQQGGGGFHGRPMGPGQQGGGQGQQGPPLLGGRGAGGPMPPIWQQRGPQGAAGGPGGIGMPPRGPMDQMGRLMGPGPGGAGLQVGGPPVPPGGAFGGGPHSQQGGLQPPGLPQGGQWGGPGGFGGPLPPQHQGGGLPPGIRGPQYQGIQDQPQGGRWGGEDGAGGRGGPQRRHRGGGGGQQQYDRRRPY